MSQLRGGIINPKRILPTEPKQWRDKKGRLVESRSIIKPKPSKHNFMEIPDVPAQARVNKRKKKQALNRIGTPFVTKHLSNTINFAAAMFGMSRKG